MRKLSLAMTAIAVLCLMTMVSCRKPSFGNKNGNTKMMTFRATTEDGGGSKTNISGVDVLWNEGDQINVNGSVISITSGFGTRTGEFTGNVEVADSYIAGYPASCTIGPDPESAESYGFEEDYKFVKFNIPHIQDGTGRGIMPMVAYTTGESDNHELHFKNLANVLELNLTGTQEISSIVVSTSINNGGDFLIWGDFDVIHYDDIDDDEYQNQCIGDGWWFIQERADLGNKSIRVDFEAPLQLSGEPRKVYVVMAKTEYDIRRFRVGFVGPEGNQVLQVTREEDDYEYFPFSKPNHKFVANVDVSLQKPVFSVGPGVTVEFAPGNLYWDGHDFRFETNSQDFTTGEYVGEWNDNELYMWNPNHVNHFYFSSDPRVARAEDYDAALETFGVTESPSDILFTNNPLSPLEPNPEFSVINGTETQTGVWRTLTYDELAYLLGVGYGRNRPNVDVTCSTDGGRLSYFAKIKGWYYNEDYEDYEYGVVARYFITFPDNAPDPGYEFDDVRTMDDIFMAGGVILPWAGYRCPYDEDDEEGEYIGDGKYLVAPFKEAYYWMSDKRDVYNEDYGNYEVKTQYFYHKYGYDYNRQDFKASECSRGCCLRLVRDASSNGGSINNLQDQNW